MIQFINKATGVDMWVHETRVEEYLAAGHKLAASTPDPQPEEKPAPKKTTRKRG